MWSILLTFIIYEQCLHIWLCLQLDWFRFVLLRDSSSSSSSNNNNNINNNNDNNNKKNIYNK